MELELDLDYEQFWKLVYGDEDDLPELFDEVTDASNFDEIASEIEKLVAIKDAQGRDDRRTIDEGTARITEVFRDAGNPLAGEVGVEFEASAYYGCRDMDTHEDLGNMLKYRVDPKRLKVFIWNEVIEPRSTIDEF